MHTLHQAHNWWLQPKANHETTFLVRERERLKGWRTCASYKSHNAGHKSLLPYHNWIRIRLMQKSRSQKISKHSSSNCKYWQFTIRKILSGSISKHNRGRHLSAVDASSVAIFRTQRICGFENEVNRIESDWCVKNLPMKRCSSSSSSILIWTTECIKVKRIRMIIHWDWMVITFRIFKFRHVWRLCLVGKIGRPCWLVGFGGFVSIQMNRPITNQLVCCVCVYMFNDRW